MKHVYARTALVGMALAVTAMSLPAEEYGWLTPALQTTMSQALPPYQPTDQAQYDAMMAKSLASENANGNTDQVEQKSPPAAAEVTPR